MLRGKKLGLLLSTAPGDAAFRHGVGLARAALAAGLRVYVYCLDEAVAGLDDPALQELAKSGAALFACADSAEQRRLPRRDWAVYGGLTALGELIAATDRFAAFN